MDGITVMVITAVWDLDGLIMAGAGDLHSYSGVTADSMVGEDFMADFTAEVVVADVRTYDKPGISRAFSLY
jgi:hypothetical protein